MIATTAGERFPYDRNHRLLNLFFGDRSDRSDHMEPALALGRTRKGDVQERRLLYAYPLDTF